MRIGTEAFCREIARSALSAGTESAAAGSRTAVYLANDSGWLAHFVLEDPLRDQAREFVGALREAGLRVHLLSGDRAETVSSVAQQLVIDHFSAQAEPQDKVAYVERLQRDGRVVVMIGDGLNDAPVLAHADASIAMGSGAGAAQLHSDLVLLGAELGSALETFGLARRTMRVIRQNFAWAVGYNAIALPAAGLGWIGPWEAAIGMGASSLIVALNSLRLARAANPLGRSWKASISSFPSPLRSYS